MYLMMALYHLENGTVLILFLWNLINLSCQTNNYWVRLMVLEYDHLDAVPAILMKGYNES